MNKEYRIAEYINGFIVEFNYSYYDYSFWGKKIKKTIGYQ